MFTLVLIGVAVILACRALTRESDDDDGDPQAPPPEMLPGLDQRTSERRHDD